VSNYRIELRPAAVKALRRIDPQDRGRIQGAIALLGEDPRPPGARALQGRDALRVRVGNYRIIYSIHDEVLLVVVRPYSVGACERRTVLPEGSRNAQSRGPQG
jgi:mRNA interferase RelE/StbE